MKWIKLFEGYLDDQFYTEISTDNSRGGEYWSWEKIDQYISFERRVFDRLNNYYRNETFSAEPELRRVGDTDDTGNFHLDTRLYVEFKSHEPGYTVRIFQYEDEWFLVWIHSMEEHYFKCDQYEGLIKCLDEEIKEHYED
jgi:hypothetical protein